jgi:hypothetical protein
MCADRARRGQLLPGPNGCCGAPNNDFMVKTYGSDGAEVPVGFHVISD